MLPITQRLFLREMTHEDFAALAAMLQDPQVMYAWEHAFNAAEVHDWIERNITRYRRDGFGYWLACDRQSGEAVGQIGVLTEEIDGRQHLGIGWILRQSCWGKGYATEAAQGCLEYAFATLHASRVIADIRPANLSSIRVAERLGMMRCGVYDKLVNGVVMPHALYYRRSPYIEVESYNPKWQEWFTQLQTLLAPILQRYRCRLEHVGSTSVPGLAAKPVLDADLILNGPEEWGAIQADLEKVGFFSRGDLGIPGREAFTETLNLPFKINFYVYKEDCMALRNHLSLRDYLRKNPAQAARYGALKKELVRKFPDDVDSYCAAKSELLREFLNQAGFTPEETAEIYRANTR